MMNLGLSEKWSEVCLDDHLILFKDGSCEIHVLDRLAHWVWRSWRSGLNVDEISALLQHSDFKNTLTMRQIQDWIARWSTARDDGDLVDGDPSNKIVKQPGSFTADVGLSAICEFAEISINIHCGDPDIHQQVHSIFENLSGGGCESKRQADFSIYRRRSRFIVHGSNQQVVCDSLDQALAHLIHVVVETVIEAAPRLLTLHAAMVVKNRTGIVLLGASGSGKSTLAAVLAQADFAYAGDDVVPVDKVSGCLVPVPVALCLKKGSWHILGAGETTPVYQRLGRAVRYHHPSRLWKAPLETFKLVLLSYRPGRTGAEIAKIGPVKAFSELVQSDSILAKDVDKAYLQGLVEWLQPLSSYCLCYGDSSQAVAAISNLVEQR